MTEPSTFAFLDEPPISRRLTSYDREHMVLYLRLLDAARDGADWQEAVQILFGLDPQSNPHRCRRGRKPFKSCSASIHKAIRIAVVGSTTLTLRVPVG